MTAIADSTSTPEAGDADVLIRCRGLTKSFRKGDQTITPVKELDLDLPRTGFLALMGPSGSGKTTLLNMLAGIDRPTSGTLDVDGVDLTGLSRDRLADWRAANIGYIFQLYHLVPVLTAYENVELPLLLHPMSKAERHERVALSLELVGLADRHDHYPRQLSGGQEQRVAIARAIVADPPILVGDEPTGDLDRKAATSVLELLTRLNEELGKALIMVTHDPMAASYAHETLRLRDGQLVEHEEEEHS